MVLKFRHFGKKEQKHLEVWCWRRMEIGPIVGKVKKARRKRISYV